MISQAYKRITTALTLAAMVLSLFAPLQPALAATGHTLSGYVRDSRGNVIVGASVCVSANSQPYWGPCVLTDETGHYSTPAADGQNYIYIANGTSPFTPRQEWNFVTYMFNITQDTTTDITVGFHKLFVHVQDIFGQPVPFATTYANANGELSTPPAISFSNSSLNFMAASGNDHTYDFDQTDANGNVELRVVDNMAATAYIIYNTGFAQMEGAVGVNRQETDQTLTIYATYPNITGMTDSSNETTQGLPQLSWDAVNSQYGATDHYNVYRSSQQDPKFAGSLVGTTSVPSYADTSATAEGAYYYQIAALDAANHVLAAGTTYPYQVVVDRTAPILSNVTISPSSTGSGGSVSLSAQCIDLPSGNYPASSESRMEYFIDSDPGLSLGAQVPFVSRDNNGVLAAQTTFTAPTTPGDHQVTVRIFDNAKNYSQQTVTLHVTAPLPAPTSLSAVSPTSNAPVLTWNPVAGAVSYIVYRDGAQIATTTATNFTDTYAPGVYNYSVAAVDNNNLVGVQSAPFQVAVISPTTVHANQAVAQGQTTIIPIYGSDILPGLTSTSQTDKATLDFDLGYNTASTLVVKRPLTFTYKTGSQSLFVNSTTIPWLVINGTNNSQGVFEGIANVTLNNGQPSSHPFRVTLTDGAALSPSTPDRFTLVVYTDSSRSQVQYQVSENLSKGKISIK